MRSSSRPGPRAAGTGAKGARARGAAAILAACAVFGGNSTLVKLVSSRVDPWRMSFVRFVVGAALASACIIVAQARAGAKAAEGFRVRAPATMAARAIFGFGQMLLFFIGVSMTSSGRATLLICTHPIFAALFGLLLFGERLPKAVFGGIALGFAGACAVLWDGSSYSLAGNLTCLAAGAANGISMHFVKRVRRDHSAFMAYLAPCVLGIAGTSFAAPGLGSIAAADWALLIAIGAIVFLGQVLLAWGLKYLAATSGSLLGLSEILFALSLSAAFLGETMRPRFFLGAALLVAALVTTALAMGRERVHVTSGESAAR
jgi:drug/metabolite transporter (DMT)-like permease